MPATKPSVERSPAAMQRLADEWRKSGKRIAFVPTMGALHEGHATLMRLARKDAGALVASIFVNPTQFGKGEDFEKYPRMLDRDLRLARDAGVDVVFAPAASSMYPASYASYVDVERVTEVLEGASRPGHFRGVATIVTKLLNIIKPHVVYFGQKDAQQTAVIRRMMTDLNIDCELSVVPTVREQDGLAMSSRNAYLTPEQRKQAPVLYCALQLGEQRILTGKAEAAQVKSEMRALITAGSAGEIDYVSIADAETLQEVEGAVKGKPVLLSLAVRFGTTRLIDNILVPLHRMPKKAL
jgi:pantoate--beta-alanine ligase